MTVTFSLLISLIVALTVIPMLASRHFDFSGAREARHAPGLRGRIGRTVGGASFSVFVLLGRAARWLMGAVDRAARLVLALPLRLFEAGYDALAAAYDRALAGVLRRPLMTLAVTLGCCWRASLWFLGWEANWCRSSSRASSSSTPSCLPGPIWR